MACVASCSDDFKITSAVSMSAKTTAIQNLSGLNGTLVLQNVFYIASENEQDGQRKVWAKELYNLRKGERKNEIASGNKHGSFILKEHEYLENQMMQWFKKTL